jgi:carboxypeptidase family protein
MKPDVFLTAKWKIAAAVFCLTMGMATLNCVPLHAQGTAGKILGTVVDQSGGAIANATVTVTDVDRNVPRPLMTDQAGTYNATNLLPGNYKVRAEAKGFKTFERTGVILDVNAEIRVDITMQPGEVSQTITVNEAVPMVETTNAELSTTLQSNIIEDIPLNGRNFENLLQLNPGVIMYPGGSGFTQSANGQRPHDNSYMVNGIMASDPWMGQSVFNAVMAAGDAGTIMPVDAIDEFKTEENPRAEYGWKPGALVNVGVKSGTNALHGSGYAYGRDTAFDARDFFNPASTPNPNIVTTQQPVALEQFGGTVGGPIKKDKLFYFANFEGQRYAIGNPSFITTPTQAQLEAACTGAGAAATLESESLAGFAPGTCTPDPSKLTTDPGGLKFQGLFPVNTTGAVGADINSTNSVNGGLGKINYHLNDKNQLEGMYFFSQGDNIADDAPATELSQSWITAQHARSQAISGDWAFTPNSTVVNELRFGYAHYYQTFFTVDHTDDPANYNFNGNTYEFPTGITNPLYFGAPDIRMGGFCGYPGGNCIGTGWPKIIGPDGVTEFLDHVSILKGKHAFKFGGEIISNSSTEDETSNAKTQIRFSSLTNFFEGNLKQASLFLGNPIRTFTNQGYAAFAQDDWRITPRLTLNLGVRYELSTVVRERDGLMGNFDPVRGIYQTNTPYNGDHNNFAPRVGFAWDIFGDGKTVLRAAGGILYESLSYDVLNGVGNALGLRTIPTGLPLYNDGSSTPLPINGNITLQSVSVAPHTPTIAAASAAWQAFNPGAQVAGQTTLFSGVSSPGCGDGVNTPAGPCEIYAVNPNLRTPYVSNWNLDIQRAITNNLSIDVGYVGNHGTKLLGQVNINQPTPGAGWTAAAIQTCLLSQSDATPYDMCGTSGGNGGGPDPNAEQAAMPFTAPCAKAVGVAAANGTGGVFNPNNSCFSYLNYITMVENNYNSNYNGLQVTLTGRNYHGLSFEASYTYSHALGDASDQGTSADFPAPENSYGGVRQQLYANTDFDIRHRFTASLDYAFPDKKGYGQALSGWSINLVALVTSGLPWGLNDLTNDFSGTNQIGSTAQVQGEEWNFFGNPSDFTPVHGNTETNGGWENGGGGTPCFGFAGPPSCSATIPQACINADMTHFSGQQQALAIAALESPGLGCYMVGNSVMVPPAFGSYGNMKNNIFRDGGFQNLDFSVAKQFVFAERFKAQFRAEFFNVLNHPHWTNPSGGPGGAIPDPNTQPFGYVGVTPDVYSSNPQLGSGGARAMQLGLKLSF